MALHFPQQSPGRTPKPLSKQVANSFALLIIERSLPALIKYWGVDYKKHDPEGYEDRADKDWVDDYESEDEDYDDVIEDQEEERAEQARQEEEEEKKAPQVVRETRHDVMQQSKSERDKDFAEFLLQEALVEHEQPIVLETLHAQQPARLAHACLIEETETEPEPVLVREVRIGPPAVTHTTELYRSVSPVVDMNMVVRGVQHMVIGGARPDFDILDSSDDDSDYAQLHPYFQYNSSNATSSLSSGSGRISTPDSAAFTMQDQEQIDYLHEIRNRWVLSKTNTMLLRHLQRLKAWYDRTILWKYADSMLHWLISEAIGDLLECMISPRVCDPFYRFTLQVMFCQEVGFLGQENVDEITSVIMCKIYAQFLYRFSPYGIRTLFTIPMGFSHPAPLRVLLRHSRSLKKISISVMHNKAIFSSLRKYCYDITEISAFAGGRYPDAGLTEEAMFPTFFRGKTKDEVIKYIEKKKTVKITFPKLERFQLHFISSTNKHFIHCLQYCYANVRTQFVYVIADMLTSPASLQVKLAPPSYLRGKYALSWDSIYFMVGQFRFIERGRQAEATYGPNPTVRSLALWNNKQDTTPRASLIREMVTRYGCSSLVLKMPYAYLDHDYDILTPYLANIGQHLTELHVSSGKSVFRASELVAGLNACGRLTSFSLDVACFWPVRGDESSILKPLLDLKTLSLTSSIMQDWEFDIRREKLRLATFVGELLLSAPNLVALEMVNTPSEIVAEIARETSQQLNIKTLVIDSVLFKRNEWRIEPVIDHWPSVSLLLVYGKAPDVYQRMKRRFFKTELRVAYRTKKLLAADDCP